MKSSYVSQTGIDPLDRTEAASLVGFTRYARARLGCETPVAGARGKWYGQLKEEMDAQGWSWEEMIITVDYLCERQIKIPYVYWVFYYVQEANAWSREKELTDLQMKVAEALLTEEDKVWVRRLSLAKGKALERVYREWVKEHGVEI